MIAKTIYHFRMKLINNDISRCSNSKCKVRMKCKRYIQLLEDAKDRDGVYTVAEFEALNCDKFI